VYTSGDIAVDARAGDTQQRALEALAQPRQARRQIGGLGTLQIGDCIEVLG
jgi:hypothetical protein